MNDFKAEPYEIRAAMLAAVGRVLESGWYVLGREVEAFERQWADICGVAHGIGVGNGMDAIEVALRASGIGAGDEVITTPMTAFATVLAIFRAGAIPVLADIDPETALLSIDSVQHCLSPRTRAVLLVHLYGQVRDMEAWANFCEANRIALIEDCAQAHLAKWNGHRAGSFGIAGAYSFYPTKNLGAAGDAGMVVTRDTALAAKAACLRNYGQSQRYHHSEIGLNSRLDEIHSAMLSERLRWLPEFTERRRQIAEAYRYGLNHPAVKLLTAPAQPDSHVYHLFVVTCEARDCLQAHLHAQGIQTLIHYPIPMHQQPPCLEMARDSNGLDNAEQHAQTCLSLPCHPQMSNNDVAYVIQAVNRFIG